MICLRLIGIVADQPRLDGLAASLVALGYTCEVDVGDVPSKTVAEPPLTDAGAPIAAPAATVDIICWTTASVGHAGAALKARAITLKAGNDYLGLLLDDVTVPAEVTSAQDVRLTGWEQPPSSLTPLIEALDARINAQNKRNGLGAAGFAAISAMMAVTFASLRTLAVAVDRLRKKVNLGLAISLGTFALGALGFFSDVLGTQEAICSTNAMKSVCRSLNLGNLPTVEEEKAWEIAKRASDCRAFETIYGAGGAFAAEAKRRLDLSRYDAGPKSMPLQMSVSAARTPFRSEAQARSEIMARAKVEAASICNGASHSFEGETAPGSFEADAPPFCYSADGGYLCTVNGNAKCNFLVAGKIKSCPPTTAMAK